MEKLRILPRLQKKGTTFKIYEQLISNGKKCSNKIFYLSFTGSAFHWCCWKLVLARWVILFHFFSQKKDLSRNKKEKKKSYACTNHLKYAQKIFNISILHFDCFAGQVFSQNLRNRLDLASSEAGPDSEDNSYLGYSLALGDFTGNGGSDLAVGMPRAANLTGKVRNHFFLHFPHWHDMLYWTYCKFIWPNIINILC